MSLEEKGNPCIFTSFAERIRQQKFIDIPSDGLSMYPFIKTGDLCRFINMPFGQIRPGDVVLFRTHDGRLIGHRLLRTTNCNGRLRVICKGDTNQYPDSPVPADSILGKLVRIQRGRRKILLNTPGRRLWSWATLRIPPLSFSARRFILSKQIWQNRLKQTHLCKKGHS